MSGWPALAQDDAPEGPILFANVDVFDGVNLDLMRDVNVVVTGNMITAVSTEDLMVAGARVIDGSDHTLMPGLADTHVHLGFASLQQSALLAGLPEYAVIHSVGDAEDMLMRGVTSVRDMAGNIFGLKLASLGYA